MSAQKHRHFLLLLGFAVRVSSGKCQNAMDASFLSARNAATIKSSAMEAARRGKAAENPITGLWLTAWKHMHDILSHMHIMAFKI